jgi:hypothetical protein
MNGFRGVEAEAYGLVVLVGCLEFGVWSLSIGVSPSLSQLRIPIRTHELLIFKLEGKVRFEVLCNVDGVGSKVARRPRAFDRRRAPRSTS